MKFSILFACVSGIELLFSLPSTAQIPKQNAIAAGGTHVLAICTNSTSISSWGLNTNGELGDGTTTSVGGCACGGKIPAVTANAPANPCWPDMRWISVKAGYHFSMALSGTGSPCGPLNSGSVWIWGDGSSGQMGNGGTVANNPTPYRINNGGMGNNTFVAIAAGGSHWLALKNDNTIRACGANTYGQVGDGTTASPKSTAVQVDATNFSTAGRTITKIACGGSHSMALCSDNTVWCWGYNAKGQCGNDFVSPQPNPRQVDLTALGGRTVVDIEGNGYTSFAVCSDGSLWSWGGNYYGQLGNNDPNIPSTPPGTDNFTPQRVVGPGGVGFLSNVISVAHSSSDSYGLVALKSDGTVWAWGRDDNGMLGNNTIANPTSIATPLQVQDPPGSGYLSGILAVHNGTQFSIFVKSNGTIYGVGDNCAGQMDNSCTDRLLPVQITPVCTSVLPVELISFKASSRDGKVLCTWSTASEMNNDYFSVERSLDGNNWAEIGNVEGAGNSSDVLSYDFIDETTLWSGSGVWGELYYRLRQVDFDGHYEFFGPVSVLISPSKSWQFILQGPTSDKELTGTLLLPDNGPVNLDIVDLQGRIIVRKHIKGAKGSNYIACDMSLLVPGYYLVKLYNEGNLVVRNFVKM